MSKKNFEVALKFLFPSEGGYVNDKNDKGGPTNMGITQTTYDNYRKRQGLLLKNVRNITKEEATKIYYEDYWKTSGADDISNINMAVALFDTAVLHGVQKAKKFYKLSNGDIDKFLDIRQKSYDYIIANDSTQMKYYKGWENRVKNLRTSINNGIFINNLNDQKEDYDYSVPFQLKVEKNKYLPDASIKPISWDNIPLADPVFNKQSTGYDATINKEIFTPDQIGAMTTEEFSKNEEEIMRQLKNGQIQSNKLNIDYKNFTNPVSGNNRIFTREEIGKMSSDEYSKYEKAIMFQLNKIGIPSVKELPNDVKSRTKNFSDTNDGKWVTINGNHVFMKDN